MSHTLIVGRSGCGKTHYLLKYLNEKCRQKHDNIHIICRTFSINSTWQSWKFKKDSGVKVLETRDVNRAIKEVLGPHKKGKKALIIFDDVAFSKDVKSQSSELVDLGFSGRHHVIETIVLTQQLNSDCKGIQR